jgi:hypothetical protein
LRKHLFLGLFADGAGIEQQDVRLIGIVGALQTVGYPQTSAILAESYSFIWQPWVLIYSLRVMGII